jgi:hypothetical protein
MYEIQDSSGRLVVVMRMFLRHTGGRHCVFRDGKCVGTFEDHGEARRFAVELAGGEDIGSYAPTSSTNNDLV